jgi:hypothetical protein
MILGVTALAGKISRDRQVPVYYTINAYYKGASGEYCAEGGDAVTVYTSSDYTDIELTYNDAGLIYSNTLLTTPADSGVYSDEPGGALGSKYYVWESGAWQGDVQECT